MSDLVGTHTTHTFMTAATHSGLERVVLETGGATASAGVGVMITSVGISLAAVASTIINVVKYRNLRSDLREIYKDEIAAKLGKSPLQITNKDMDAVAAGIPERGIAANETLAEELDKLKRDRNLGIGVTLVSILFAIPLALSIVNFAVGTSVIAGISASISSPALNWIAGFAAKSAVGFLCHKLMEYPVEVVGKQIFNIEGNSTHERIESLIKDRAAGKTLSKEQVLGVFVGINQQLSRFVQQSFGTEYDTLGAQAKEAVVKAFEQYIPLEQITDSLNSGRVKITELAFSAVGQSSGVAPNSAPVAPQLNVVGKVRGLVHNVNSVVNNVKNQLHTPAPAARQQVQMQAQPVAQQVNMVRQPRRIVEYDNPEPSVSFVQREQMRRAAPAMRPEIATTEPSYIR